MHLYNTFNYAFTKELQKTTKRTVKSLLNVKIIL